MNLKFISRTFDLISKEECSETFCVRTENEVIVRVLQVFLCEKKFRNGVGEVVATGKEFLKLIGRKVEFMLTEEQSVIKEYEVCEGKFCLDTIGTVLVQAALTAVMLAEYIAKNRPKYVMHVSGNKEICRFLQRLCEGKRVDLVSVDSPKNSGVLSMLKYDLLLVGDFMDDVFFEERTPRNSTVLQYSTYFSGRILHQGTYIKQSVFDWFSTLSFFHKKKLIYFLRSQSQFQNSFDKVSIEQVLTDDFSNVIDLDVQQVFSQECLKGNRKFSIDTQRLSVDTQRLTASGLLSVTCSERNEINPGSIDEIVNMDCLTSPRVLPARVQSEESEKWEESEKDEKMLHSNEFLTFYDSLLKEHLLHLIAKYNNPQVMKTVEQLERFFETRTSDKTVYIKLLEEDLSVYQGEMNEKRQPEGFGSRYFVDGTVFRGFWKEGKAHGKAVFVSSDGTLYTGCWKNGFFGGYGSLVLPDKSFHEGCFMKGELCGVGIEVMKNGEKYHGQFLSGYRHGKGVLTAEDGQAWLVRYYQGVIVEQRKSFGGKEAADGVENSWKDCGAAVVCSLSSEFGLEMIGEGFGYESSESSSETFSDFD